MLAWTEENRLKGLAYNLANLMKNEFMHEFVF